jgi:cyclopropane fatty-acyl-phospholipid synthase-like methyltransferase
MNKYTEAFIDAALELSDSGISKISEREREIFGLSSDRLRSLLNNLCSKPDTNYLELGVYKGATLVSALYGNPGAKAIGVENYRYDEREPKKWAAEGTIWENIKSQLHDNLRRYNDPDMSVNTTSITLLEDSFEEIDWTKQPKSDVCFFDINPVTAQQYDTFFTEVLKGLKTESLVVFTNYSNDKNANELEAALQKHSDKLSINWKRKRISSGLSDSTQYYSGILILGIKKTIAKTASK